ncbi:MAG: DUF4367 domain-containing protein [Intestinibacter sp.]|uniref:DUF4367 domain-containing protein n=1 Tax=Intestinibacter sp. TaxID=1965304 RepID=UPI003F156D2D
MRKLKVRYIVASICVLAVVLACFVKLKDIGINYIAKNNSTVEQTENIDLNINKIKVMSQASLDADIKTIEIKNLPERFEFMENIKVPSGFKLDYSYNVYTRSDINSDEYDTLHDYVFYYQKDDGEKNINLAFSEIEEPIRDYYIENTKSKKSKIGDIELVIYQFNTTYIVMFNNNGINFDIETNNISESELVELLKSIIVEK